MDYYGKELRKGRFSEPGRPYLVTAVTQNRQPVFNNFHYARLLINELRQLNETKEVESLAWVIMPDHMHWLITLHHLSLSNVIKQIKGRSASIININRKTTEPLWQRGFHDHALRKEEDIESVARYVIANPLRAGLVEHIGDYPHWDAVWV